MPTGICDQYICLRPISGWPGKSHGKKIMKKLGKFMKNCQKPRSHLAKYFFRLFMIEMNSAIANNLKHIGLMKRQCVTIHLNIYECVSDYMEIHKIVPEHFTDTLQDS